LTSCPRFGRRSDTMVRKYLCKSLLALIIGVFIELCVSNLHATVSLLTNGSVSYDINLFRIVIVPLIYLLGSFLFSIQKMPDYQAIIEEKEKSGAE
jgi:hypothetical protein